MHSLCFFFLSPTRLFPIPVMIISAILAVRGVLRRTSGPRPVRCLGPPGWNPATAWHHRPSSRPGEPAPAGLNLCKVCGGSNSATVDSKVSSVRVASAVRDAGECQLGPSILKKSSDVTPPPPLVLFPCSVLRCVFLFGVEL